MSQKKGARKKTIRYFRWSVKIIFLLILVMPIRYFAHPGVYSLPISSLTLGVLNQPPICLSYGQSVCHFLLFSWVLTPGGWVACPVGGLQVLLTMGIVPQAGLDLGWLILSLAVAVLFFFVLIVFVGSMFCSWVCPLGTIIDGFDKGVERFMPKTNLKREERLKRNREKSEKKSRFVCPTCPLGRLLANKNAPVANGLLVSALVGSAILRVNVFCTICPIGISNRGMFHLKSLTSVTGRMMPIIIELWVIPIVAILASFREKRYWCRKICPVGACLNIAGSFNPLIKPTVKADRCIIKGCPKDCEDYRIDFCGLCRQVDQKRCERACPQDINLIDEGSLANCTKCLECYIQCERDAINIKLYKTPDAISAIRRFKAKWRRRPKDSAK